MAENLNLKTVETVDTRPFRKLVMTIGELPTSFIESMTYYELLAWFTNYLETVIIPTVNNNGEAVEELQQKYLELKANTEQEIDTFENEITTAFNTLKNFVDNYFDNLDVQDEINNKLDEMAEAGTLQEIIYQFLQSNVTWVFDTVDDMKAATNLIDGSYAQTLGSHEVNDGGGGLYHINTTGTPDGGLVIDLNGTLKAHLIINNLNIKQFGATGDGTTDDSNAIKAALATGLDLIVPEGTYLTNLSAEVYNYGHLTGTDREKCILKFTNKAEIKNLYLDNLSFIAGDTLTTLFDITDTSSRAYHINNCVFDGDNKADYLIHGGATSVTSTCEITNSTFTKFNKCGVEFFGVGDYFLADNCQFTALGNATTDKCRAISLGSTTDPLIKWTRTHINNCIVDNLTTMDSTGNDSVECQAIRVRGGYVDIINCSISNIHGEGQDHEGIYVKSPDGGHISNNHLVNCGHGNGAITAKPFDNAIIEGNIVTGDGCCIYSRGTNLLVSDNKFTADLTNRTSYQYDDSASFNAVVISEGFTKFINNEVVMTDPNTRSENTGAVKVEISPCDIINNKISATQTTFGISFNSGVTGLTTIKGNLISGSTVGYLIRNVIIAAGFALDVIDNTIECGSGELISSASGANGVKNLLFDHNTFHVDNYTGASLFIDNNINSDSTLTVINNIFTSATSKTITNLCQVKSNVNFTKNRLNNVTFSRYLFVASGATYITLEDNEINGVALRMNTAVTFTTVTIRNNFIIGSGGMFTSNMLTATTAYILNNMMGSNLNTSYLTATNLYNKNNTNYTA